MDTLYLENNSSNLIEQGENTERKFFVIKLILIKFLASILSS